MKTTAYILLIVTLLTVGCRSSKPLGDRWITVTEATSQAWSGGAYGSGYGITYNFRIRVHKGGVDEYRFDTVFTDRRAFVPVLTEQGDGYLLRFEQSSRPRRSPEGEILDGVYDEQPERAVTYPQFEGEAMIVGHRNGDRFLVIVDAITRLEPLNYP